MLQDRAWRRTGIGTSGSWAIPDQDILVEIQVPRPHDRAAPYPNTVELGVVGVDGLEHRAAELPRETCTWGGSSQSAERMPKRYPRSISHLGMSARVASDAHRALTCRRLGSWPLLPAA